MATATESAKATKTGKVVQVIGPVVDIEFESGYLPAIYNAVRVTTTGAGGATLDVVCEVEQHLGENRVRTVAMKPTDGMRRGMEAIDTGAPLLPVNCWFTPNGWGFQVGPPIEAVDGVQGTTQALADRFAAAIAAHPADWHMLQRVWTADFDGHR